MVYSAIDTLFTSLLFTLGGRDHESVLVLMLQDGVDTERISKIIEKSLSSEALPIQVGFVVLH